MRDVMIFVTTEDNTYVLVSNVTQLVYNNTIGLIYFNIIYVYNKYKH